eukprot:3660105-Prymnesium_polylepis.1
MFRETLDRMTMFRETLNLHGLAAPHFAAVLRGSVNGGCCGVVGVVGVGGTCNGNQPSVKHGHRYSQLVPT